MMTFAVVPRVELVLVFPWETEKSYEDLITVLQAEVGPHVRIGLQVYGPTRGVRGVPEQQGRHYERALTFTPTGTDVRFNSDEISRIVSAVVTSAGFSLPSAA